MFAKIVKGLFKLCFLTAGTATIVGIWDYTQQAKAAGYVYSYTQYQVSVLDRYGDEAAQAFAFLDTANAGLASGVAWVAETGLLETVGLSMPDTLMPESEDTLASVPIQQISPQTATQEDVAQPIQLASVTGGLAPERSLLPRARVVQ